MGIACWRKLRGHGAEPDDAAYTAAPKRESHFHGWADPFIGERYEPFCRMRFSELAAQRISALKVALRGTFCKEWLQKFSAIGLLNGWLEKHQ